MWYELHDEDAGAQLAASEREADVRAVVAAYVASHGRAGELRKSPPHAATERTASAGL